MIIAITRQVSRAIQNCELTHLERQPIDLELARTQHGRLRPYVFHCPKSSCA